MVNVISALYLEIGITRNVTVYVYLYHLIDLIDYYCSATIT